MPTRTLALALLTAALAVPARAQTSPADPPPAPVTAAAPAARAPLPPPLPWSGASERLIARAGDPWITPAEASGFERTPPYAETVAWLRRLAAASPLVRLETFGRSPEGRDLIAAVVSRDGPRLDPAKPVVLVQAGIHAGEIDGKDAGLMLLRDIALRDKANLLDRANLVFVPIFNVDGHERTPPGSRPHQRGPMNAGWRTTAQNINLNRDYLKADAPEMRAMIGLIRRHDPALYIDLHVTDGQDMGPDATWQYNGWFGRHAQSPAIGRWLHDRLTPALRDALGRAGHRPGFYVDLVDPRRPEAGVHFTQTSARYSNGYADLRRVPSLILEGHSLKPYRQRVLAAYVFVAAALAQAGDDAAALRAAIAADRASRPQTMVLDHVRATTPDGTYVWEGVAQELYRSPASGREEVRYLGRAAPPVAVPRFMDTPDRPVPLPVAWWVPASATEVIDRLALHGIAFERLDAPRTLTVETARLIDPKLKAASEGRVPLAVGAIRRETRAVTFPAGSVRVAADQPLALLAAAWLEAESPEGALAWGFFPGILHRTEYMEPYLLAPLAERMLAADPALAAAFRAKLGAEPAFAADPDARLAWFYARSGFQDERWLLYPIARELRPTPQP